MQLLRGDRSRNLAILITVLIILGVLLIALAVLALLGDLLGLLDRFRTGVYLFIIGGILAYLLTPAVQLLQRVLRKRWAAVLGAYLLLFVCLLVFTILLLFPFITQAQSLVANLQTPSARSLVNLQAVQRDAGRVQSDLSAQATLLGKRQPIPRQQVQQTQADIDLLARQVASVSSAKTPRGAIRIPPSYLGPIVTSLSQLRSYYRQATARPDAVNPTVLDRAAAAAKTTDAQANAAYRKAASSPMLLLDLQTWLDVHGMSVDLQDKFSQALQQVRNQLASILNNAVNIAFRAGNLLVDTILVLIISIYFVNDGGRFIRWLIQLVPARSRGSVTHAVANLDQILRSYIRTQVLLALLAGILDASGAAILGIPYAVVIFFSSFLLSLVPVIGPVILPFPPLLIALIFAPLPRPLLYIPWLLAGEQFATNVVGPRMEARNLRIHPLEAMAAALVGLPLAGLPGAFFAVPVVAFFHIVVREFMHAHRTAAPTQAAGTGTEQPPTGTELR